MRILKRFAAIAVIAGVTGCVVDTRPYPYYHHTCGYGWYWDGYRCRR